VATVETPGVEFAFPEYLARIVAEVHRRWQRPSGRAFEAEIQFLVHRDGSVTNLHFTKRSGDFSFDLEAQGAVEAAGRSAAFGPLPPDYPADVLPVTFFFAPRAGR
jgi:protein TonB